MNFAIMSPFWRIFWAIFLAVGWLLPNHYRPWTSFYTDTWIALIFLLLVIWMVVRVPDALPVHAIAVWPVLAICLIWIQFAFGKIFFAGDAWISTAYLLGFVIALLSGANCERYRSNELADAIFFAIGFASIISVGFQLHQWFRLDGLSLVSMGGGESRPYANLGQSNQLATLLLWGVLAAIWGVARRFIHPLVAIIMMCYLLFGVALTGSRTAWIGVVLIVVAALVLRSSQHRHTAFVATGLGLYFLLCVIAIASWRATQSFEVEDVVRFGTELRPLAWKMFADAVWAQPLVGYGWNQTTLAQVNASISHPAIHGIFTYSHNLFLDLVLWAGLPLGILFSVILLHWLYRCCHAIKSAENAVLVMFLVVVANHAMLELPLYYAYLLFPTGLVMGILNARLKTPISVSMPKPVFVILLCFAALVLGLIIRDYSKVEESYRVLRMEWDRFKISIPKQPPDTTLLTQWDHFITYARFEPKASMDKNQLDWMRNVTAMYPNPIFINKLALALAMNGYPEEAQVWLMRLCKIARPADAVITKTNWEKKALELDSVKSVVWPKEECTN